MKEEKAIEEDDQLGDGRRSLSRNSGVGTTSSGGRASAGGVMPLQQLIAW